MKKFLCVILTVLFASGCTMAPKYKRPIAPIPGAWPSGNAYPVEPAATAASDAHQLKWRDFFSDPKLKKIIETALENNRNLRIAALNAERARAMYGVRKADLFPVLNADGSGGEQRQSLDFTSLGAERNVQRYDVNLGVAAWEIDFFGRIRSLQKQALEEYLKTEEARRSAQIALISGVAMAYVVLAADKSNLNLARSTFKAQEKSHKLILRQYELRLVNEIDLRRSRTQVDTARGDVARYTQLVAQDKNTLNLLAGMPVPDELSPVDLEDMLPFKDITAGLSSDLLLLRPDVMAAEHQLKGANANIGAARAAFFPRISLTTTLGSTTNDFSHLFKAGTGTWAYAPQIVMPIFDARTWSAARVSKADQKIALAQYEKTVQTAFKEVADVLAVRGTIDERLDAQQSLVDSSQLIYDLSNKRYANGIDSYLSVLDAQRSLYSAQQGLIALRSTKIANEVKTYSVLGGGVDYGKSGKVSLIRKFFSYFRF